MTYLTKYKRALAPWHLGAVAYLHGRCGRPRREDNLDAEEFS